jgi:hypothetical protein
VIDTGCGCGRQSLAARISRLPDRDCDQLQAKMIPISKYRRDR